MSVVESEFNVDVTNESQFKPVDVDVLKRCGEIILGLFKQFKTNELEVCENSKSSSTSSCSIGETYAELLMAKRFDRLFDMMSHDLENADTCCYQSLKLNLYYDLGDFMDYVPLHKINRFIFGNGPKLKDWDLITMQTLDRIRNWRIEFDGDVERVPYCLIEIYKMESGNQTMCVRERANVAFAIFSFLLGYDPLVDIADISYMFRLIECVNGAGTFRTVFNSTLRHTRMFMEANASDDQINFFEALVENTDVVAAANWIFDLLTGNTEAYEKFTSNPFSNVSGGTSEVYDGTGAKLLPSYVVQLRIFYRWLSKELLLLLSGGLNARISLMDKHVKQCLCTLNNISWTRLFDDTYVNVLKHFTNILVDYDCPENVLETFRATCDDETFKSLIKLCVSEVDTQLYLKKYRSSSTDSNESKSYYSNSSQCELEDD